MKKAIVIQVAALGQRLLQARGRDELCGLAVKGADSVFPAVTCTVQASLRTAAPPAEHGMVANGFMHRELGRPLFWEQSAALVHGPRIWERFREGGGRVAMLFWQQSLGETVDMVLSPAPIHKHHGGMVQDCYSQPRGLYAEVARALGRPFDLKHYWGPCASAKSSRWIAEATACILAREDAPELVFTYLPALDYDLQRFGPDHPRARQALDELLDQLALVVTAARNHAYEILIVGDYAIEPCSAAVFPNRALYDAGLMQCRRIRDRLYPDLHSSRAFAVVDHQVAHVYVRDPGEVAAVHDLLQALDGVDRVLGKHDQVRLAVSHQRSGELLALSRPGYWMAYPWWADRHEAPDYATHVDIHNKPGYDPVELFCGMPPWNISLDASRIRGTHGRVDADTQVAWASSMIAADPADLLELTALLTNWLDTE